jgi:hypothetical protein
MKIPHHVATLLLAAGFACAANAQLPPPEPDLTKRPQCTADYRRSVERQVAALAKLRTAGPEAVGQLCTLIEMGSEWLGGELPDDVRRQLKDALGIDIDLQLMLRQCWIGQGNLERELMTRLGGLRSELVRCTKRATLEGNKCRSG